MDTQADFHRLKLQVYRIDDQNSLFGRALLACQDIPKGNVVLSLRDCEVLHAPTRYSVYVGGDRHVEHPILARLNHSCSPNVFVDIRAQEAVTMRDVGAGEVLSFFYPSTEWAMSHPFMCECGSDPCMGLVAGAAFAPDHVLARHLLNDHIDDMLKLPELREQERLAAESVAGWAQRQIEQRPAAIPATHKTTNQLRDIPGVNVKMTPTNGPTLVGHHIKRETRSCTDPEEALPNS